MRNCSVEFVVVIQSWRCKLLRIVQIEFDPRNNLLLAMVHMSVQLNSVSDIIEQKHEQFADSSEASTTSELAEMEADDSSQDNTEVSGVGATDCLHRTESQMEKQIKLQTIAKRYEEHHKGVQQLREQVSQIVASISEDRAGAQDIQEMLLACRKRIRNLQEDLLEDTLALDNLAGLFHEDRSSRKSVLNKLDALLEEVDVVKSALASSEKDWIYKCKVENSEQSAVAGAISPQSPLEAMPRESPESAPQQKDAATVDKSPLHFQGESRKACGLETKQPLKKPSSRPCHECGRLCSEGSEGDSEFEGQWFCPACWHSWAASEAKSTGQTELPVLGHEFWKELPLTLKLEPSEDRSCYNLCANLRNLRPRDLHMQLSHDASLLTVSGVHFPSAADVQKMQKNVEQHFARLGAYCDAHVVQHLYARLGEGSFGHFSEKVRLPRDVDVTRIAATCDGGMLHIKLPKHSQQRRSSMRHPLFGASPFLW